MEDVMLRGMDNLISYSQIVWLSSIFYNACLGFIKTSVLALYARLGDRELRRLAYVIIGVVACQAGANVIVCIFQCTPVQAACESTSLHATLVITTWSPLKNHSNAYVQTISTSPTRNASTSTPSTWPMPP